MQRRVGGIAFLKIDGRQYETTGSLDINPGQPMREGKLGTSRLAGYIEKPQIASFEGKLVLTEGLSLIDFSTLSEVTITIEGPNGTTHILRDAWYAGETKYSTEEGEVGFKFEGLYEEITA